METQIKKLKYGSEEEQKIYDRLLAEKKQNQKEQYEKNI